MSALVAGWFSFANGHATAGDLLSCRLACEWLEEAGFSYDVAVAPPFVDGLDWRKVDPKQYSHVLFVCGPFAKGELEAEFLSHFQRCRLIGLNLSMSIPLDMWNPWDLLIERDSSSNANPDMVFLSRQPQVPVVGICLVEEYEGAMVAEANASVRHLIASKEMSIVEVDTRLDTNGTGLRTPAEIESLIARMDVVVTTRLHGTVLALKNGVPVVMIDPEAGGAKLRRQAETIGWPVILNVDNLSHQALQDALDYCLTDTARIKARECRDRAASVLQTRRAEFISELSQPGAWEQEYRERIRQIEVRHTITPAATLDLDHSACSQQSFSQRFTLSVVDNAKALLKRLMR